MFKPGDILMIHEPKYDRTILGLSYWTHCLIYVGNDKFIDATGRYGVRSSTLEKVKNRDNFDFMIYFIPIYFFTTCNWYKV